MINLDNSGTPYQSAPILQLNFYTLSNTTYEFFITNHNLTLTYFFLHQQVLLLIALISMERVNCDQNNDDIDEFLDEEDNDDEPEPIKKRQFNAVRETIRSVVGAPVKFFTNGRLIKGVQMAIQSQRIPKPGSGSTVTANGAGNIIGTIYRTMRSQWSKNSQAASSALRKQLLTITKRLSNSKVILGNMVGSHKMTNREESATKEATADLVAAPTTAETKTAVKSGKKLDHDISNNYPMPYPYQMAMAMAQPQQFFQSPIDQQQHLMQFQMPVYPELLL